MTFRVHKHIHIFIIGYISLIFHKYPQHISFISSLFHCSDGLVGLLDRSFLHETSALPKDDLDLGTWNFRMVELQRHGAAILASHKLLTPHILVGVPSSSYGTWPIYR